MCTITKDEVAIGCLKKAVKAEDLTPPKTPDKTKCEVRRRKEDLLEGIRHSHFDDSHLLDVLDDE